MVRRTWRDVIVLAAALGSCGLLNAQPILEQAQVAEPAANPLGDAERSPFDFTVAGGYIYQSDSEPDNADDFTVDQLSAGVGMRWQLNPDTSLMFRVIRS
jgi:hypothetical protein